MTTAVDVLAHPKINELIGFAKHNRSLAPKWNVLADLLEKRVVPARVDFQRDLAAASAERNALAARLVDTKAQKDSLVVQLAEVDRAIHVALPAQIADAEAAPARIAAEANESLTDDEVAAVASALESYASMK